MNFIPNLFCCGTSLIVHVRLTQHQPKSKLVYDAKAIHPQSCRNDLPQIGIPRTVPSATTSLSSTKLVRYVPVWIHTIGDTRSTLTGTSHQHGELGDHGAAQHQVTLLVKSIRVDCLATPWLDATGMCSSWLDDRISVTTVTANIPLPLVANYKHYLQ